MKTKRVDEKENKPLSQSAVEGMVSHVVEGKIEFAKDKTGHIFSRGIVIDEQPTRHFPGLKIEDVNDWLYEILCDSDDYEGLDIEMTVVIKKNG